MRTQLGSRRGAAETRPLVSIHGGAAGPSRPARSFSRARFSMRDTARPGYGKRSALKYHAVGDGVCPGGVSAASRGWGKRNRRRTSLRSVSSTRSIRLTSSSRFSPMVSRNC